MTKEVDMVVESPFLLAKPDFSKTEVVKSYVHTIVVPVMDYWKQTIEVKKGDQLERMKTVRIFNPMYVLDNKISESDIDGLKIFKFYEHPDIRVQWKSNCGSLPGFMYVLCAVLTNSPNSCPSECLFNTTYNDDTTSSILTTSSIRLTMTIRSRLTPTTLNYRYSHSLTNEPCGIRVSR